jgi:hypothetical protein
MMGRQETMATVAAEKGAGGALRCVALAPTMAATEERS